VTAAGALGLVAAGAQVGHSGGTLVYRHGAASAYATAPRAAISPEGVAAAGARSERRKVVGDDR
jgi:hypothetical protein